MMYLCVYQRVGAQVGTVPRTVPMHAMASSSPNWPREHRDRERAAAPKSKVPSYHGRD